MYIQHSAVAREEFPLSLLTELSLSYIFGDSGVLLLYFTGS